PGSRSKAADLKSGGLRNLDTSVIIGAADVKSMEFPKPVARTCRPGPRLACWSNKKPHPPNTRGPHC
ncbi:MAG: hypothetical protein ACRD3O_05830, partial [Terriglobia bacterium]